MRISSYVSAALLLQCCSAPVKIQSRTKAVEIEKSKNPLKKSNSKTNDQDSTKGDAGKIEVSQTSTIETAPNPATASDKGVALPGQ